MGDEKTTVLLIEDNPGDARLIQEYISEYGSDVFKLEHFERLSYGLKFLDECDAGIILLDISLPDSKGLEGLLKILAKAPDVPVVVLSGINDEAIAIQAVHEGAQDYLVKGSIDGALLVRLLRHAIERHHLRVAVQESESRYRLLAENIADVIWVADEEGWITYVSPSVKRLLGYTAEEVEKNFRINDILTPDSAEQARRLIDSQMEVGVQQSHSTPLSLTLEYVRNDGSTVWAEVMLSFLLDKKGHFSGIMGATRDITARKIAEETLQRSEEHFRALIENASDVMLIINGDGVLQYESPSIQRLLGYRFEERVGKSVFENIHPDDRQNVIDAFVQLVQEAGKIAQMEMRVRHENGSWRIIDATAKNLLDNPAVNGIVVNFHDITERKEAEKALRISEEKLRRYWDSSPDAMYVHDLKGTFLAGNKTAERMTGYSREEIEGKSFLEFNLLPPEYLAEASRLLQLSAAGIPTGPDEFEMIRKDGSRMFVEVSAYPMIEGDRTEVIGVARDITERKRMEEALKESETRFRTVFEGTSVAIALVDRRGKPLGINPAFSRMFGYGFEEFCSLNMLKYLYPEDAMVDEGLYLELINGKRDHYTIDKRYVRKSGEVLWGRQNLSVVRDTEGKPEYFIAMVEDITEQKKMEEEVRRLSDAVRMSTEGIFVADLEGRAIDANQAALKIFGVTDMPDLIGKSVMEVIAPEDREKALETMKKALEEGKVQAVEYHVVRKDGSIVLAEISVSVLRGNDGKPTGFVAVARDITERKKMEEEVRRLSDAVKMSTESVFVADLEGKAIDANQAALKMSGATDMTDLIGKGFMEIMAPEDQEKAFENTKKLLEEGQVQPTEYRIVRNDGSMILAEVSASVLRGKDGEPTGFVAVARDITERKKMEEEVRRLSDAVKMTKESIVITDLEGNVLDVNAATVEMFGVQNRDYLIGLNPFASVLHDDQEKAFANLAKVLEHGYAREVQYHVITRDGRRIFVETSASLMKDETGVPIGVVAVTRDITGRKRMEDALRLSEERFRLLVSNAQDIVFRWSIDRGLEYVSPVVLNITGYSAEELMSNPILTMELVGQDNPIFIADYRKATTEGLSLGTRELSFIRKDGKQIYLDMLAQSIKDSEGKMIAFEGILRDITERKSMENVLRQREQDYLILVESTQEGIVVIDAETLKVVFGNRRSAIMFGFDPELQNGVGINMLDLVHPDDREMVIRGFVEDLSQLERRKRYEVRMYTKDGRELLISALATRIEFQGKLAVLLSTKDITERKKAEDELRLSEQNYRVLFESMLDGMVVADTEIVKIVVANQNAAKMFGFDSAEQVVGMNPLDFIHPEDKERVLGYFMDTAFGKLKHEVQELRTITKDGREMWVSCMGVRIEYGGKPAILASVRDIGERKKAEGEKQRMEEQLRLAGRLAAVGELAAGVAHELNNPIAAMQGYAQLLAAKKDIDESVKKDLDIIYREAQRAGKITKNLLSFARRHEPEKHFISINEALEKTLEISAHRMKINNIELEVELERNLPGTMADFYQMQQIFVNIITNAEQAMLDAHGKGKLVVRTRRYGDMIQVVFTDDGPGIAEENLNRIFDPFFTTKVVGKGTGLGLSICYGLVEAHNGRIYARSKLGEGATFIVEIPIVPEGVPATGAAFIKTKKGSAR